MDERSLRAWRLFLEVHSRVTARLEVELRDDTGMPLAWYDVLVQLSEAPEHRLRMQELARRVLISKSGLTRLFDRMCDAGYVAREPDPVDGRGTLAVMTEAGRRALHRAAPAHLASVARIFADQMTPDEVEAMVAALQRILDDAGDDRGGAAPATPNER